VAAVCGTARDLILDALLPKLAGSFYLTNSFAEEYRYAGGTATTCVHCGGLGTRKRLRHPMHGAVRLVDICARCGIVADTPEQGPVQLVIEAPDLIDRGSMVEVRVAVDWPGAGEVVVGCRLSTHGNTDLPPEPERHLLRLAGSGSGRADFRLPVPVALPPHEYSVKVLAASRADIAFAHRLTWVR
jgi:hypothetical protein